MRGSRPLLVGCGLAVAVLVAGLDLFRPAPLAHLDRRVQDELLAWTPGRASSGRVVIVDIDDRSLERLGRWPWPRGRTAALLDAVRAGGPATVAVDLMFPEPDLDHEDRALAEALGHGPFVLGYQLAFDGRGTPPAACRFRPVRVALHEAPPARGMADLFRATGALCNVPRLADAAPGAGFLNAARDPDGLLRRLPLLIPDDARLHPSLALAAVIMTLGVRTLTLRSAPPGIEGLVLDGRDVPLDARGNLLLRFRGARPSFPYLSAADVLGGRVPASALAGKVVVVGTSAVGLREVLATPVDTHVSGVEIHATAIDNLLAGDVLARPLWAPGAELLAILVLGPAAGAVLAWAGPARGGLVVAAGAAGLWPAAGWFVRSSGFVLSPLFPALAVVLVGVVAAVLGFVVERRQAERGVRDVRLAQDLMMQSLGSLAEIRDTETGDHLQRTQRYARSLGEALASHPRFREFLRPETIDLLAALAPLHDIGKVGVPDHVLRKPGGLTAEEYEEVKRHVDHGRRVIERAETRAGVESSALLRLVKDIVATHHERWDGSGYPAGLQGDAIPVAGRLMAVVDVYDALVSRRVYKEEVSHEEAVRVITAGRGTHFDPDVVDAFLRVEPRWRAIAQELAELDGRRPVPGAPAV